jgi:ABC-type multidrug transport system fused ATPase/permease subunit
VGICTFTAYIALGNDLDVATALTSLALFEILRFPLYMLPNVINNIIEAQVSFNRIQSFLLETEKESVSMQDDIGCNIINATIVWDVDTVKNDDDSNNNNNNPTDFKTKFVKEAQDTLDYITGKTHAKLIQQTKVSELKVSSSSSLLNQLSPEEVFNYKIHKAQLHEAERLINKLQTEVNSLKGVNIIDSSIDNIDDKDTIKDDTQLLTLSRINFKAAPGDIIAIVGQVGSGKSSILSALLGDMKLMFGDVSIKGQISYVGQRPFIQNCTLRDNIYFGSLPDKSKYEQTLYECALVPDLKVLPAGDMTEIGERGINLSGGQKSRVALARAVYAGI